MVLRGRKRLLPIQASSPVGRQAVSGPPCRASLQPQALVSAAFGARLRKRSPAPAQNWLCRHLVHGGDDGAGGGLDVSRALRRNAARGGKLNDVAHACTPMFLRAVTKL